MSHLRAIAFAVFALNIATAAKAADLPMPPPVYAPAPKLIPAEFGSNWYIRGDAGYVHYNNPSAIYGTTVPYYNEDLDHAFLIGAGVGYQWHKYFRTDITVDWRSEADFFGRTFCAGGCGGGFSREYAKVSGVTSLFNGYFDMGTWYGFTPYVGAGAGFSWLQLRDYRGYNPPGYTLSTVLGSDGKFNFAWAVMGGFSYDVGKNTKIDMGYRYIFLGDAQTKIDSIGNRTKIRDISAHEVRLGFRYLID